MRLQSLYIVCTKKDRSWLQNQSLVFKYKAPSLLGSKIVCLFVCLFVCLISEWCCISIIPMITWSETPLLPKSIGCPDRCRMLCSISGLSAGVWSYQKQKLRPACSLLPSAGHPLHLLLVQDADGTWFRWCKSRASVPKRFIHLRPLQRSRQWQTFR